ncbi:outer membrane beta-barrel protein [Flaviaesturariibacter flavus]|nr:outer membrane beta-barrel protein [Flaviaesturariibacter flavus]
MLENNFERDVQKKMGELRFEPSAPVWEAVSRQINQKRRRRRALLIWFFFGLLLLGGGGLLLRNGQRGENPVAHTGRNMPATPATTGNGNTPETGSTPKRSGSDQPVRTEDNAHNEVGTATAGTIQTDNVPAGTSHLTEAPAATGGKQDARNSIAVRSISARTSGQTANIFANKARRASLAAAGSGAKKFAANITGKRSQTLAEAPEQSQRPELLQKPAEPTNQFPVAAITPADTMARTSPAAAPALAAVVTPPADSNMAAQPAIPKKTGRKRMEWNLGAWAGASRLATAPASSDHIETQTYPAFVPATPTYAASLGAGVQAGIALPLQRRLALTASLGYAYYSVYGSVSDFDPGNAMGAGLLPSAAPGPVYWKSSARFTWHYITAGAGLRWKPLERLQLSAGLNLGVPVGGKAWVYRYDDRSFVPAERDTKMQLFWQAGVEFRLWEKGSRALFVGPGYQRGFSRTGPDGGYQLSAPGLQARFRF